VLSGALDAAACALADDGHYKQAWRLSRERMELLDRLPRHDPRVGGEVADIFHMATESALAAGELHTALVSARRAHDDSTREGLAHFAAADLIIPFALQGAFEDALAQGTIMREGWERAGRPAAGWMAPAFYAIGLVHGLCGDDDAYTRWRHLATAMCRAGTTNAFGVYAAARVALHHGAIEQAYAAALVDGQQLTGQFRTYAEVMRAEVAVASSASDAADRLAQAWHLGDENDFAAAQLSRAAGRLHDSIAELDEAVTQWEAIGARFERASTLLLIPERADEGAEELAVLGCPARDARAVPRG
jgi:hypothetical protein